MSRPRCRHCGSTRARLVVRDSDGDVLAFTTDLKRWARKECANERACERRRIERAVEALPLYEWTSTGGAVRLADVFAAIRPGRGGRGAT